ncbi:hypothetical protein SAMN02949497_0331 [Methylomagnum ishizawai]|uniref:TraD/TraG TraM recognition site domain-containing protein n=3 Tax=Methylomagnum ishizawai TaxID=1760988 RepID=A0A1Y6DBG2_9GAMM|nr:hypothetical protein SAMN02949497_0331 [Methylomagnum ishizawai]
MPENYSYSPGTPLLKLSQRDIWTLNDAYMGAAIIGGTGSGKTSGSGRALALSFLRAGMGGLVLCAKPGEADLWWHYAEMTGRQNSMIFLGGKDGRTFNFLEYEMARQDAGSSANNAVSVLMRVMEAMRAMEGGGRGDAFWTDSVRVLLSNALDVLYAAYGQVSLPDLMRFVTSAPRGHGQVQNETYRQTSFFLKTMEKAGSDPVSPLPQEDYEAILQFFCEDSFGSLDNKTRSNIIATLSSMVNDFLKGDLRRLFCTNTTTVPELSHEGAVIVLDFPLKIWERGGILAQQIFKFAWQRAIERRPVTKKTRPCFLWADECQLFMSSYDAEFQSTARSSHVCAVSLTQSLPALYHAASGTGHPEHTVNAYLTNFQTKIIHACQDHQTMKWAADLIGRGIHHRKGWNESTTTGTNRSASVGGSYGGGSSTDGKGNSTSSGNWGRNWGESRGISESTTHGTSIQEVMDYLIEPSYFASELRTGGKGYDFCVDGILFQGGRKWKHTSAPWLKCTFRQR